MPRVAASRNVQTTLRLPRPLYDQMKAVVKTGLSNAASINDLIVAALREHLRNLRRRQIDAGFAGMANDANYREVSRAMADEFLQSDWEVLQTWEKG